MYILGNALIFAPWTFIRFFYLVRPIVRWVTVVHLTEWKLTRFQPETTCMAQTY
jgi:hypothetical protein